MIKIAITQRVVINSDYHEIRECLDARWAKLFNKIEFLPIILPHNIDFRNYKFDGIVLSGGDDIGEFEFRDKFEYELLNYCWRKDIPVFGVCRGMQIIATFFGSKLKEVDNQIGIWHSLAVNDLSKYAKFLKDIKKVNSYHNIAVDKLGKDLKVSAWNEDKTIIKAIEHTHKKILGVMWHSEREEPFVEEELKLIEGFFR